MAFLNFFIRPEGEKPPLSQLFVLFGRFSSTLAFNTFLILIFHLRFFREYGVPALVVFLILLDVTLVIDGLVSNSLGRNIENLRRAGYSDGLLLAYSQINLVLAQTTGFCIIIFLCTDPEIYSIDYFFKTFGIKNIQEIAVNLTLADLLFAFLHSSIHKNAELAKLHELHHCATHSSWSTGVLFHPIDTAIEFAGPVSVLLMLHFLLWDNQLTLLVNYLVVLTWYTYDHDEDLRLPHHGHHATCDSVYVAYSNFRGDPKKNFLKQKLQEIDLKWPESLVKTKTL